MQLAMPLQAADRPVTERPCKYEALSECSQWLRVYPYCSKSLVATSCPRETLQFAFATLRRPVASPLTPCGVGGFELDGGPPVLPSRGDPISLSLRISGWWLRRGLEDSIRQVDDLTEYLKIAHLCSRVLSDLPVQHITCVVWSCND